MSIITVYAQLDKDKYKTSKEIAQEIDIAVASVNRALKSLIKFDAVLVKGNRGRYGYEWQKK